MYLNGPLVTQKRLKKYQTKVLSFISLSLSRLGAVKVRQR